MTVHYDPPHTPARWMNTVIGRLAEWGISIAGTRALWVRGRRSGVTRRVVVNVMGVDGRDYVVSPRGNTQWSRNARAAGVVELGPRWRRHPAVVTEVADESKPELLRRYLHRWYWEVKGHVAGLRPDSSTAELVAAAPLIPVFALGTPNGTGRSSDIEASDAPANGPQPYDRSPLTVMGASISHDLSRGRLRPVTVRRVLRRRGTQMSSKFTRSKTPLR